VELDLLNLYERASEWTGTKVRGAASDLDATTTCDEWNVRTLMNHMLETQRYFIGSARGQRRCCPKIRRIFSVTIRAPISIRFATM
jgi:hypothetical protein